MRTVSAAQSFDGGPGADTMIGGRGPDGYVVDNTGDVVIENANDGTDDDPETLTRPTIDEIVTAMVESRYGTADDFSLGVLVWTIQDLAREELGLPAYPSGLDEGDPEPEAGADPHRPGFAEGSAADMDRGSSHTLGTRMEEITDILQWALRDPVLWAEIKDWELETSQRAAEAEKLGIEDPFGAEADAVFGPPQHPAPNSRIVALVKRRFGDQKFDYFLLTIALKRLAREELGLPTDLSLKDDDVEDPK